jgi:hypothetical protein
MASFSWGELKQAADDAGFSVIPAATYNVIVKKAEAKKTGTGKDKINVQFVVSDGPYAGKPVFNDFVLSPENGTALGFFFRHMKALGLGAEYFAANPPLPAVAAALVGRPCQVEVGVRVWNEEDRNEVNKILPPLGGAGIAAMAEATAAGMPQPQPMAQPVAQPRSQPVPAQPVAQPQPAAQPAQAVPTAAPVSEPETALEAALKPHVPDNAALNDALSPPELPF